MKLNHYESFQFWILFAIHRKNIKTKEGLIKSPLKMLSKTVTYLCFQS